MRPIATLSVVIAAMAPSAVAQTPPYVPLYTAPYGAYPGGGPAAIADQHRYENDRLRRQSEANAALARQQQIETRQRLMQIEAAREPTVSPAVLARPLYDVAQERSLREGAAARRQQTRQGVTQIDDWLDRPN